MVHWEVSAMRFWSDFIDNRRTAIHLLLFSTVVTALLISIYKELPPPSSHTPNHITAQEQAIVLQEDGGFRILLLYDPIMQQFRCAVSHADDPTQTLYSPSIGFSIKPGHPLTIRYPDESSETSPRSRALIAKIGAELLPTIEVCITQRPLTVSRASHYTSETFLQEWHVRWKPLNDSTPS